MSSYVKIIFILLITCVVLFVTDKIISKGDKKYYSHSYQKLDLLINGDTNFDILFIGSSKMHTAINPEIVDAITGLSAYNAGVDGAGLPEFKMIFEGYLLKHPAPKKLYLGLDGDSFDEAFKFVNYNLYLHFLDHKVVDTTLANNGFFVFPYNVLPFLRIIESDDVRKRNAFVGLFGKNETHGNFQFKGYLANGNDCIYPGLEQRYIPMGYRVEPKHLTMLNALIATCKEMEIELTFVYLPEYDHKPKKIITTFDQFIHVTDSIALSNKIVFLRDDSLAICYEKCFFSNYGHLNTAGSTKYSEIFATRIAANDRN